jgi:hypothetical protein
MNYEPFTSIENPTLAHFRHFSSLYFTLAHFRHFSSLFTPSPLYICRELSTNQLLFMQNKPNFQDTKMNVNLYNTTDYENIANWTLGENKPNQTQWIGNELKSPISPKLTKCPIYQRSYLYYATADLINAGTVTLTRIWNLRIFHSIISHRNASLTSASPMPEITKTDE